uniref:Uncharacterized protein n=1 Tax=Anopheles culicifacies TaxID=139723 RepID=A0A182LY48_9DIPT
MATKPKMRSHYRGHKMALWLNLIPQLHRPGDPDVSMRHHHFREREPHYYAGSVRAESFSRPRSLYQNGVINDAQESRQESFGTECTPDPTMGEVLQEAGSGPGDTIGNVLSEEEEAELLAKLANRHYYSYTAALGVTVGVGCLLLLLNMLIFAGIYYQRDRTKRKSQASQSSGTVGGSGVTTGTSASLSGSNGTPDESGKRLANKSFAPALVLFLFHVLINLVLVRSTEIPLTSIPTPSPVKVKRTFEPPPSYATLPKRTAGNNNGASSGAGSVHHQHHHHHLHQHLPGASSGTKETKLGSPLTTAHLRTGSSTLGRSGTGSFYDSSTNSRQQQQQYSAQQQVKIPLTSIPTPSPVKAKRTFEPPPSYATLPKRTAGNNNGASSGAGSVHHQHHHHHLHQHLPGASSGTKETKLGSPLTTAHLRTGSSTLGRSGTGSFYDSSTNSRQQQQQYSAQQQLISPHSSSVAHTAVTITPTATVSHHQTLPRASKAPLPPIRSTTSSSSASTSSGTASTSIAPLTSILVNSTNNNHQHQHHYQQQGCELGPQSTSNVITVDLVSSTTAATGSPSTMGGHQHQHHHHHHHAHHHANGSGPVATSNTGNAATATTAGGSGPPAGSTATLKKRVQIQEVTV